MSPYIFVVAAALAVIPMLIIFKVTIERIKEDPSPATRKKATTQFFIGIFLSEVIPIILFIYGFANLVPADQMEDLFVPGLIILLLILISGLFVFMQRTFDVPAELKDQLNVFAVIGFAVTNTIPILTIVGLIMMIP